MTSVCLLSYLTSQSAESVLRDELIEGSSLVSDNFYQYGFANSNLSSLDYQSNYDPPTEGKVLMPKGAVAWAATTTGFIPDKIPVFSDLGSMITNVDGQHAFDENACLLIRSGKCLFYRPVALLKTKAVKTILQKYFRQRLINFLSSFLNAKYHETTAVSYAHYAACIESLAAKKGEPSHDDFQNFLNGIFEGKKFLNQHSARTFVKDDSLIARMKAAHLDFKKANQTLDNYQELLPMLGDLQGLLRHHDIHYAWTTKAEIDKMQRTNTRLWWGIGLCCLDLTIYNSIDSLEKNDSYNIDGVELGSALKLIAYVGLTSYYLKEWYANVQTRKYTEKKVTQSDAKVGNDLEAIEQESRLIFVQVMLVALLAGLVMGPLHETIDKDKCIPGVVSGVGLAIVLPFCASVYEHYRARSKGDKFSLTSRQLICMLLIGGVASTIFTASQHWLLPSLSDWVNSERGGETLVTNLSRGIVVLAGLGLWKTLEKSNVVSKANIKI